MRTPLVAALALMVAVMAAGEEVFVPMVAQKQGQDGSWWNTEIWVTNTTVTSGGYAVVFLPAGQANLEGLRADPALEDLAPGVTVYRNDVVPQGGVGTLRIIKTPGVLVFARVFNAAGKGSFGEGLPGLARSAAIRPGDIAFLMGLRRTPQFRTNVGLFNPSQEDGVVRIRIVSQKGDVEGEQPYRLPPGAFLQINDVLHAFGVTRAEHLHAEVTGTVPFFALASVVDARSGAPTLIQALH